MKAAVLGMTLANPNQLTPSDNPVSPIDIPYINYQALDLLHDYANPLEIDFLAGHYPQALTAGLLFRSIDKAKLAPKVLKLYAEKVPLDYLVLQRRGFLDYDENNTKLALANLKVIKHGLGPLNLEDKKDYIIKGLSLASRPKFPSYFTDHLSIFMIELLLRDFLRPHSGFLSVHMALKSLDGKRLFTEEDIRKFNPEYLNHIAKVLHGSLDEIKALEYGDTIGLNIGNHEEGSSLLALINASLTEEERINMDLFGSLHRVKLSKETDDEGRACVILKDVFDFDPPDALPFRTYETRFEELLAALNSKDYEELSNRLGHLLFPYNPNPNNPNMKVLIKIPIEDICHKTYD